MKSKHNGRKSSGRRISKRLHPENVRISVTVTPSLQRTGDKRYEASLRSPVEKVGPREQAARLAQYGLRSRTRPQSRPLKLFSGEVFMLAAADFEALKGSVRASLDWLVAAAEDPGIRPRPA